MVLRGGASAAAATALDAAQAALARESQRLHQPRPRVCGQLVQIVELEQLEAEPIVADPQPGRLGLAAGTATVGNPGASFVLTGVESASCR